MKIAFVTGGTGHIGNYLVTKLVALGWRVKVLINKENETAEKCLHHASVKIIHGNILDKKILKSSIQATDVVFHLASLISIGGIKPDKVYEINVGGTKNIVDVCLKKKVRKLVYVSSYDVIHSKTSGVLVEPNKKVNVNILDGDYAKSKGLAFNYVMDKIKKGLKCSICFPATCVGPGDYLKSNLGEEILNIINNKMNYGMHGALNLVDVRDVATGIYLAYQKGKPGDGYLLTNKIVILEDFIKTAKICLNRKPMLHIVPTWFLKCIAPFSEFFCKLFHITPVLTRYSLRAVQINSNFSNNKAKHDLGWTPKYSIKESIKDAICWFAANKPEWITKKYLDKMKV